MKLETLKLDGVKLLLPKYFEDERGYYCEIYSKRAFLEYGIDIDFVQDNHSLSVRKNTLRGIHFQIEPKPQIKLVRCTKGKLIDYVVDLRKNSLTFKQWLAVELSEENRLQLLIPTGFGHAFLTLEDNCEFQYKTSEFYYPEYDRSIAWDDPDININWPVENPIMSLKDKKAPLLRDSDFNFHLGNGSK